MAGAGGQAALAPFGDLFAAIGWHPQHRRLLQLLANATAGDAAALASALLEAAGSGSDASGSSSPWHAAGSAGATGMHHGSGGGGGLAPGKGGGGESGGPVDISWLGLVLAALVIGVNGLISFWLRLGLHGKLAVATVRCMLQLSILGYILVPIFLADRWWLTALYTLFMLAVAAIEAVSRPTQTYNGMLLQVLGALGLASSAVISYGLALVVRVSPWWDPQYLIPMLGMLLGNACSGVAVGLSTILDELTAGRDKVEMLLAMGASRLEATREVVQRAARMALTPLLNTMNVVGIVSIPGMMTGQILGGSDPATAARYQIMIMFLIGAATGLSSVATIFLAVVSLVDDRHRLRSERLQSRPSTAKGAVAWLATQARVGWAAARARAAHLGTRLRLALRGGAAPGRVRRSGSSATVGGTSSGASATAGYRPLAEGDSEAAAGGASDPGSLPSLPSRLREVLVAGSVGSSAADLSPPPSVRQPLLGRTPGSSDTSSLDRSPRR